jgi:Na+/proline symporter
MNALATVATKDFYFRFFRPTALETDQVKFSRYATVVVGILAILISILISIISRSLGETVLEAASMWVAIMCVIAPTFLVGVLSRRSAAVHITTAIICGWIATGFMIAWYYTSKKNGHPISFMFIQIPGMLTTTILGLLLPYIFGKPAPESKTAGLTLWAIRQTEPTESEKHVEELAK